MNNLKRIILLFVISIIGINPLFVYAGNPQIGSTWGEEEGYHSGYDSSEGTIKPTYDVFTGGYGIYIKLIKYDLDSDSNKEKIVGNPILLYSGGLLDDITEVTAGAGSAESTTSFPGGMKICVGNCGEGSAAYEKYGPGGYTIVPGNAISNLSDLANQGDNFEGGGVGDGYGGAATVYDSSMIALAPGWVIGSSESCINSSASVYNAEEISYYKTEHIRFLFDKSVKDDSVSSDIKNNTFGKDRVRIVKSAVDDLTKLHEYDSTINSLYDYIKIYLLRQVSSKRNDDTNLFVEENGKITLTKLFQAFSINSFDFVMNELDTYYLSFEPVTREKTGYVVNSWSTSQTTTTVQGSPSWSWNCVYLGDRTTNSAQAPGEACRKWIVDIDRKCVKTTIKGCAKWEIDDNSHYDYKSWTGGNCKTYKFIRTSTLITNHSEQISVIQPAREGTSVEMISAITTSIDQPESEHCVRDKTNMCVEPKRYEYFIGPNLQTSLVGTTTNNKYQLYDSNKNHEFTRASADVNAVGVSYWWLPNLMTCKRECEGKTDDDLLMCAENFCDNLIGYDERANTQKLKAYCITSTCGYSYTPVSCETANPYASISNKSGQESSTCGVKTDGSLSKDSKKVNITCVDDSENEVFDQKRYINIACKEETGIGFSNLVGKKIVAGQGIDYYVEQIGNRECRLFWDTSTWKFAYASYHSQDIIEVKGEEISTREQLVKMLNYFNTAQDRYFTETVGIDLAGNEYSIDYSNGTFNSWESMNYDKNVTVETNVKETVNNEESTGKYTLVETYSDPASQADVVENTTTKGIHHLQADLYKVNGYLQKSDITKTYTFDKYCVSKDGKAVIKKALENGQCPDEEGFIETEVGKNVYYTNLNATANKDFEKNTLEHSFSTTVVDSKNVGEVLNNDSCPYEVEGPSYECVIDVVALDGTEMHGNGIFARGGVTASLKIREKLGTKDSIKTTEIKAGSNVNEKSITINMRDTRNGHEQYDIVGEIVTTNGKVATCKKTIHIVNPDDSCGAQCSIEELSDYRYEIKSVGVQNPSNYFSASSVNFAFVKLAPDVRNGKYVVRVEKQKVDYYLYGKVSGTMVTGDGRNNTNCNDVCWIKIASEDDKRLEDYNCETKYAGADYDGIKSYCEQNWDKDINHYESIDECKFQCGMKACPDEVRDLDTVQNFCDKNYVSLGYDKAINCVNYCYYCPECSSEYVYRQVNNYNPFPKSSDSNTLGYNYLTGDRVIGSNWVGKSEYIKRDDNDTTSITGIHANQNVEYVIELTPDDIKAIKNNTELYNYSVTGNDAYLDYIYQDNTDVNGKYYSKFINDEFRKNFTVISGEVVR